MRFILGELFDTWSWQPNDRKWFWLDGIESCCVRVEGSSKSICVRRFFPSPLFLFRFHFSPFPQKRLIPRLAALVLGFLCQSGRRRPENVSILSSLIPSSARAWTSVILAGKPDSRRHSTTGFSELSNVRSFIILRSRVGLTSFNTDNSAIFSNEKKVQWSFPGYPFF